MPFGSVSTSRSLASPAGAFDGLRLVEHHALPVDAAEVLDVGDDQLVGRHHHVEAGLLRVQVRLLPERPQHLAILRSDGGAQLDASRPMVVAKVMLKSSCRHSACIRTKKSRNVNEDLQDEQK